MPSTVPQRGLRISDELYLKLRVIAETETRSFNNEVVCILKDFVEKFEKEHGVIEVK